jgi:hypothetical protein
MTPTLIIASAALLLLAVPGCAVSPYGDSPRYYTGNGPSERSFDKSDSGDRDNPIGHEIREYDDQRYRN